MLRSKAIPNGVVLKLNFKDGIICMHPVHPRRVNIVYGIPLVVGVATHCEDCRSQLICHESMFTLHHNYLE